MLLKIYLTSNSFLSLTRIVIILKSLIKNLLYIKFKEKQYEHKLWEIKIINLPTKLQRYILVKSPHVNKKSKEKFKITTYKQLIIIKYKYKLKFISFLKLIYLLKKILNFQSELSSTISFNKNNKKFYSFINYQKMDNKIISKFTIKL